MTRIVADRRPDALQNLAGVLLNLARWAPVKSVDDVSRSDEKVLMASATTPSPPAPPLLETEGRTLPLLPESARGGWHAQRDGVVGAVTSQCRASPGPTKKTGPREGPGIEAEQARRWRCSGRRRQLTR